MDEDFERGPLWIRAGMLGAATYNVVGIVTMTRLFTADFGRWDPLFDAWGCVLIVLWGLAYLTLARRPFALPWLAAVFMMEKLVYTVHFVWWQLESTVTLEAILEADPMAASFFGSYGLGDGAFAVFFGAVWITGLFARAGR